MYRLLTGVLAIDCVIGLCALVQVDAEPVGRQILLPGPRLIRYRTPGYEFTLRDDGSLAIRASGPTETGTPVDYTCTTSVVSAFMGLFSLAFSDEFLRSAKEYLPRKGTFEYHGHDLRKTISVESPPGKEMHRVTFSDVPVLAPPASIKAVEREFDRLVWVSERGRIERDCGPIPRIVIAID